MTPRAILIKNVINMLRMYVDNMIIPWMNQNDHIVAKLLETDVLKSQSQEMREMLFARDD